MSYCEVSDVGSRIGLDSAQRTRAQSRLENCVRRAGIEVDQCFLDYGRSEPTASTTSSTLNGAISVGATTITLTDASSFSTSGSGNVGGDSFSWTGKTGNDLTGVSGISFSHANASKVQEGQYAHVVREICADIAAGFYLEDESSMQNEGDMRGTVLRERGMKNLIRLAHLGSV